MSEDTNVKQKKSGEQFPLLKMAVEEPRYKVTSPRGWLKRTTDYAPACWISLMLVIISIMAVLALSVSVNKRQSILFKWFSDKHQQDHRIGEHPADVFFHKIIQDRPIYFDFYSLYLSDMATKYPFLRFHVYFLIDDSRHDPPRHYDSMLIKKLFKTQIRPDFLKGAEGESFKEEIAEFTKVYKNVNVTIKPLSEHVRSTMQQKYPIKCLWKNIPKSTLQFYAGVHAVWKNGGIALDLDTFSDDFKRMQYGDQRIKTIFERYNEGLGVSKDDIDRKRCPRHEDSLSANFYSMFSSLRDLLFTNSTEVITIDVPQQIHEMEVPHVRTHRSKREAVVESFPIRKLLQNSINPLSRVSETAATKIDTNPASMNTDATPSAIDIDATESNAYVDLKNGNHTIMKEWTKKLPNSMIMFDIGFGMDDGFMLPPLPWDPLATIPKRGPPFTGLSHVFAPIKPKTPVTPQIGNSLLALDAEGKKKKDPTVWKKLTKELPNSMIMFDISFDLDDDFMQPPRTWNPFTLPKRGPQFTGLPHVFTPPKPKTPVTPLGNRLLVLDAEGRFMASSVRYHAFLGRMLFSWRPEHSTPRNILESVLSNNCYGSCGEASYCSDVYFL